MGFAMKPNEPSMQIINSILGRQTKKSAKRGNAKKRELCSSCGCELSFGEMIQSSGQLCFVCERNETERDNLRKIQQGNDDEQLGYTFSGKEF